MDWSQRVSLLSVKPDTATRDEVARMATEILASWAQNKSQLMPAGCQCNPGEWDEVTPICGKLQGEASKHCEQCEHNRECHGVMNA